jgi:hypothetical protein
MGLRTDQAQQEKNISGEHGSMLEKKQYLLFHDDPLD